MHDARDAEDIRLLEAGEIGLLLEGYLGVTSSVVTSSEPVAFGTAECCASKGPSSPSNKKVTLGYFPETIRCLSS